MYLKTAIILISLLFFQPLYPQGQKIKFEHLSIEDGLSNSTVLCIFQDSRGFIWIGTTDGLNRYDGKNFKIFRHEPKNPHSLSHNEVFVIFEDKDHTLWIGTSRGGLNKFNKTAETFTRFQFDPNDPQTISSYEISSICQDQAGMLWIGTRQSTICGLNRLNPSTGKVLRWPSTRIDRDGINEEHIYSLQVTPGNFLWIGIQDGGLLRLDLNTIDLQNYQNTLKKHYLHNPNNLMSLSSNDVRAVYLDAWNELWIGTSSGGLNRFNLKTEQFTVHKNDPRDPNSLSHNFVKAICRDRAGLLWVGTWGGGLDRFDPETGKFLHFKHNPDHCFSLSNNIVTSIIEDRSGVIWIGTWGGGINKWVPASHKFQHVTSNPNNSNSLSHSVITAIVEDETGKLWVGTYRGLNRLDRKANKFSLINLGNHQGQSVKDEIIIALYQDRFGNIWVGTVNGLYQYNPTSGKSIHYQHVHVDSSGLPANEIICLNEDRFGDLWVGTREGLARFDRQREHFVHYEEVNQDSTSLNNNFVKTIYEDRKGILWITSFGLNRFDRANNRFIPYFIKGTGVNRKLKNGIFSIYEDIYNNFWMGTAAGLFKFDRVRGSFQETGFNYHINGILGDSASSKNSDEQLWISTKNNGLFRFNPQTKNFKQYSVRDGLQGMKFYQNSFHRSRRTGEMFFGGINGLNAFFPDNIKSNPTIPPIVITDFKIMNKSLPARPDGSTPLTQSLFSSPQIVLSHQDYIFSFEFAALDYTMPERNQFAYMLEGFDQEWVYSGNRNFVTYTNIAAGDYVFRVKGSNNDGVWNETGAAVKMVILPPWWETGWAWTLYLIIFSAAMYSAYRLQLRRIRIRNELDMHRFEAGKLQEINRMKSRFFANISHEFRTPLTLILGPLELFLQDKVKGNPKDQFRMMHRYGTRLLQLINQLLDLSKLEAGRMALRAEPVNIVQLTKGLVNSFESLAEKKKIKLLFDSTKAALQVFLDRDKFEKIIINLLSNAFKFTEAGGQIKTALTVIVEEESPVAARTAAVATEFVQISVSDTGIGIPQERLNEIFGRFYQINEAQGGEQTGTGIGLALTKELVELHHGKITVESEPGKGSTFTIWLRLGQAHLKLDEIIAPATLPEAVISPAIIPQDEMQPVQTGELSKNHRKTVPIILIVEDNLDVRKYIRDYIEDDYQIIEAENGMQGLERAVSTIPDLILSDVMMPVMDGFEFCEKIKTDERTSHIPVILLTARAGMDSKLAGLETGADDYLTKPLNLQELCVRIKNLIEQRRKLRERFARETKLSPKDIAVTSVDEKFLQRAIAIIEKNIDDPDFTTQVLARQIGMSRSQLHRKLNALTDKGPQVFIRIIRLKRAAQLLAQKTGNVTEIAYEVGFASVAHFSKRFREFFGKLPSEYQKGS